MKRQFVLRSFVLLLVCYSHQSYVTAQSQIKLLLNKTSLGKGISSENQDVVDRHLLSLLSDGGGINHKASAFIVQPSLDFIEQGKIEGMKSRQTVKINLQLKLVHAFTSEVLEVRDVLLVGTGESTTIAVKKAIATARRTNPALQKQLAALRQSAVNYIAENCSSFITSAEESAVRGEYQEAFAMLHAIPQGTDCYAAVADKKQGYFSAWQETACATELNRANTAAAQNDFSQALSVLSNLDADAPCFDAAKAAILAIESKVDDQLKDDYDWMFKFYAEGKEAETARWNAMNNLFLFWLNNNGNYEGTAQPSKN